MSQFNAHRWAFEASYETATIRYVGHADSLTRRSKLPPTSDGPNKFTPSAGVGGQEAQTDEARPAIPLNVEIT